MTKGVTTVPALKRVAFDQLIMAPIGKWSQFQAFSNQVQQEFGFSDKMA